VRRARRVALAGAVVAAVCAACNGLFGITDAVTYVEAGSDATEAAPSSSACAHYEPVGSSPCGDRVMCDQALPACCIDPTNTDVRTCADFITSCSPGQLKIGACVTRGEGACPNSRCCQDQVWDSDGRFLDGSAGKITCDDGCTSGNQVCTMDKQCDAGETCARVEPIPHGPSVGLCRACDAGAPGGG
jgi:hypothetical protein